MFHVYTYGREAARQKYPSRVRTTEVDKPIGLSQLYQLRCSNDRSKEDPTAYQYGVIGVDDTARAWNEFGIFEGFMTHTWRDELERLMDLSRADGQKLLAAKKDEQMRREMNTRFN